MKAVFKAAFVCILLTGCLGERELQVHPVAVELKDIQTEPNNRVFLKWVSEDGNIVFWASDVMPVSYVVGQKSVVFTK